MMNEKLIKHFKYLMLTYAILIIILIFIQLNFNSPYIPLLLLIPPLPAIFFFWKYVQMQEKAQRDVIKSLNDGILYIVSGVIALCGLIKTLPYSSFDIFDILFRNNIGYTLLCFYSLLVFIKAYVAICETKQNIKIIRRS